jgi:flagellar biosynthetic protein FlhB
MAEDESGQEKKHEPSSKGWEEAAEKGQIPRSMDFASAAVIVCGAGGLVFGSHSMRQQVERVYNRFLDGRGPYSFTMTDATQWQWEIMEMLVLATWVPLAAIMVGVILVNLAQSGFQISSKALEPNLDKFNLVSGFKQMYFSWTPWVEMLKSVLKMVVLSVVVYFAVSDLIHELPLMVTYGPAQMMDMMATTAWRVVIYSLPFILIIATGDYAYSYYQQYQQLLRTDQQVRDENKDQEGNQEMKGERKKRARELAFGSIIAAVSDADVVITNPTHFAVALSYNAEVGGSPIVLCKGVDEMALKIQVEARRIGVPRIENRSLARALYAKVKAGHMIPEDLFGPVAKVLAIVFRRRAKRKNR